jgi:gliding motility-associated-like protein
MAGLYRFICVLLLSSVMAGQVSPPSLQIPYPLCTELPATFTVNTDTSMDIHSYAWKVIPSTATLVSPGGSVATIYFANPGTHQISVTLEYGSAPSFTTLSRSVVITRSAKASFNASLTLAGHPNELRLTNYSTNFLYSYWVFDNGSSIDSSYHAVKYYSLPGSHTVTQVSEGNNGCHNVLSYEFTIPDASAITLPTIFSPNNDGVNDVYRPLSTGISNLKAKVVNRHGITIATWEEVNGFWDGYTISGEPCDEGVYFIVLQATGFEGTTYSRNGTITLVR